MDSDSECNFEDYAVESEISEYSENDLYGDENHKSILPTHNYFDEVKNILISHDSVTNENALVINENLQRMLIELRNKLQNILVAIQEKYKENQHKLDDINNKLTIKCSGYRMCRIPFFKDARYLHCPLNPDYVYRKKMLKEFFPIDLLLIPKHHWTLRNKISLIQGIKRQLLDYIESKERTEMRLNNKYQRFDSQLIEKNLKFHSSRLVELLGQAQDDFQINWFKISIEDLDGKHSENSCYAMWNLYLRPDLNRSEWTDEENEKLLSTVQKYNFQNWKMISTETTGRSEYQCFLQFETIIRPSLYEKNQKWSKTDDDILKKAVEANQMGSVIHWNKILSYFPYKSRKQLYARYMNTLKPEIKKGAFTREEDCIIMAAVEEYGENFSFFPRSLFPGRTLVQVRSHYMNVLRHTTSGRFWSVEDDKKLLKLVDEYGSSNWSKISEILKPQTRTSCRTRYMVINKHMMKNPNMKIEDLPRKKRDRQSDVNINNWVEKICELKRIGDIVGIAKKNRKELRKNKISYLSRLRPINREYYNCFKYSYDFEFGQDRNRPYDIKRNLLHLIYQFKIPLFQDSFSESIFTRDECKILSDCSSQMLLDVKQKENYIPINWCTVIGLRGISLLCSTDKSTVVNSNLPLSKREKIQTDEESMEVIRHAKSNFKTRFFMAFCQTVLLSQLDYNVVSTEQLYTIEIVPSKNDKNFKQTKRQITTVNSVKPSKCETMFEAKTCKKRKIE